METTTETAQETKKQETGQPQIKCYSARKV